MGDAFQDKRHQIDWTRWRKPMPTIITDFHRENHSEKQNGSLWVNFFNWLKLQRSRRQSKEYLAQFDDAQLDDLGMLHTIRVVKSVKS
jgi:uncharacterized protein YjiS (DUF1127 family)